LTCTGGVGRKLAESVQYLITFSGAMGYAFYSSWRVSLVVLTTTPFLFASVYFLLKMNNSQSARANATYARAGSIVNTAISSLRTILSLNAVERTISEYNAATREAHDGAVSQLWLLGIAYGSQFASFMLAYMAVTLYGTWLLYEEVTDNGCDPSGTVEGNSRCEPSGVDVFGALMGVSFAAAVLPQVSVSVEKFMGTWVVFVRK
jgi:ATP-binding cassette subfamily B (MDR/TAP) protein 1